MSIDIDKQLDQENTMLETLDKKLFEGKGRVFDILEYDSEAKTKTAREDIINYCRSMPEVSWTKDSFFNYLVMQNFDLANKINRDIVT